MLEAPPTLPDLPDAIVAGNHYQVTEVLFTLSVTDYGDVNWRAFIEPTTGAVLYLRAFMACATGMIFRTDPVTAGAGTVVTPTASAAMLNPFRSSVVLDGAPGNDTARAREAPRPIRTRTLTMRGTRLMRSAYQQRAADDKRSGHLSQHKT